MFLTLNFAYFLKRGPKYKQNLRLNLVIFSIALINQIRSQLVQKWVRKVRYSTPETLFKESDDQVSMIYSCISSDLSSEKPRNGDCLDTGAQTTVIGKKQAQDYYNFMGLKLLPRTKSKEFSFLKRCTKLPWQYSHSSPHGPKQGH